MKKTAVIALFAFAMLPFSACSSNSDQSAYMTSSSAEQNAREAEQAEEEFAQLASKEETPKTHKAEKHGKHEEKVPTQVTAHKAEKKAAPKAEHKAEHKTEVAEHKAVPKSKETTYHKATEELREPASTHEAKAHKAVSSDRVYTVQLGAFKVKENAEKLTAKLKGAGFPVMLVGKDGSKSGELYLVHLEPTPNKTEAEKWQTDLKLKSFDSTLTSKRD